MKFKLVGSHYILFTLPIWATAGIFAAILSTVLVGRDLFEGMIYNVAYSSMVGDVALLIVVLIATTILKAGRATKVSPWLQNGIVHPAIFSLCVILGTIISHFTLSSRSGQVMDIYHDIIIAPLFLYLAVTLLPLIFKNGTKLEKRTVALLIALWFVLLCLDTAQDRMNQRRWLHNHVNVIEQMK